MKKIVFLISYFFYAFLNAQLPTFDWVKNFGSNASINFGNCVATDAAGNVYTTGYFNNTVDFDPGVGTYTLSTSGNTNVFISKLDAQGNFVWAKKVGGSSGDRGYSITVDHVGNILVTGFFTGGADFNPGPAFNTLGSNGIYDVFILKLDPSGNYIWAKNFGGMSYNIGNCIKIDSLNNVYTSGYFQGTADFDPGAGTYNLTSAGNRDIFISKLDTLGNFVGAKQVGDAQIDESLSLAIDKQGSVYYAGYYNGTVDFDPGPATFTCTANGNNDIFISKLSSSGNFIWTKNMGSTGNDVAFAIATDPFDNILITGIFEGTVDLDPNAGIDNHTAIGNFDIFISKLDSAGLFLWAKQMGSTSLENPQSIATDAQGNVYTTGLFTLGGDYDPGPGVFNIVSNGGNDAFFIKLTPAGNFVWAFNVGGPANDICYSISVDPFENIYSTGFFGGTTDFDPGIGVSNLSPVGTYDVFTAKFKKCITPAPPVSTTPTTNLNSCAYQSATLSVTGNGVINWFSSSTNTNSIGTGSTFITSTLSAGNYIFYAESNTCIKSSRTPVTLTVQALPDVFVTSSTTLICVNEPATLAANGANSYTWDPGGTSAIIIVSPSVTTTYSVTGMGSNGCLNTTVITISTDECVGLDKIIADDVLLRTYPSPVKDILYIELKNLNNKDLKIQILNSLGQLLLEENINISPSLFNIQ